MERDAVCRKNWVRTCATKDGSEGEGSKVCDRRSSCTNSSARYSAQILALVGDAPVSWKISLF